MSYPSVCRVLFFGALPDVTGCSEWECPIADGDTVGTVLRRALDRWPALDAHTAGLRMSINLAFAAPDEPVPADAEVALLPPVQGG